MPRGAISKPISVRFWRRVEKRGEVECWPWRGGRGGGGGHGTIRIGGASPSKTMAHRVSWELHNGQIPEGLWVLHRCDNPPCCNPAHLFLGTAGDNARDRDAKGRGADHRGALNGRACLTPADVAEIRRRYIPHQFGMHRLARMFGVSKSTVMRIVRGTGWTATGA